MDNNFKKQYCFISLKGTGIFPRLNFDRREIILPIVPLSIEAVCSFYLINDGYENFQIRDNIVQEHGNLDIRINYVEGSTIGLQKNRLRVDIHFLSSKSQSFTTKIEFFDDNMKPYTVILSGTCDNSIMTCFQYIQRNMG